MVPAASAETDVRFRKLFVVLAVALISVLFLHMVAPFFEAMFLAVVLTGMLYPFYIRLREATRRDTVAAGLTVLVVLFAVVLPILFLGGVLTREIVQLTEYIKPWIERSATNGDLVPVTIPAWVPYAEQLEPYQGEIVARLGGALSQIGSFFADSVSALTQRTFAFVLNLFLMLYALFFFLLAGPRLLRVFDFTPLSSSDRELIIGKGISITRATLKGTLVIGALQGALGGAAFAVVGFEAPVFWGCVMALASVVPALGAALVWVPAVGVLLYQGQIAAGLGLLGWCTLVVSTVDNLLRPRLVGRDTRMHDLVILFSTLGGLAVFGPLGFIIGPVLAGLFVTGWQIFGLAYRDELVDGAPRIVIADAVEPVDDDFEER